MESIQCVDEVVIAPAAGGSYELAYPINNELQFYFVGAKNIF